jgi:hypothetical protein
MMMTRQQLYILIKPRWNLIKPRRITTSRQNSVSTPPIAEVIQFYWWHLTWRGPTSRQHNVYPPLDTHTHTHIHTRGRASMNEWPARRGGLTYSYTTYNRQNRRISGFEPAIPALKREQTFTLDRKATEIGTKYYYGKQTHNDEMGGAFGTHGIEIDV